jgi:hypothetical protein
MRNGLAASPHPDNFRYAARIAVGRGASMYDRYSNRTFSAALQPEIRTLRHRCLDALGALRGDDVRTRQPCEHQQSTVWLDGTFERPLTTVSKLMHVLISRTVCSSTYRPISKPHTRPARLVRYYGTSPSNEHDHVYTLAWKFIPYLGLWKGQLFDYEPGALRVLFTS